MGPAIVGLVGVIIGAMLSGTLTVLMARRSEKHEAHAAARLLEAELRSIAQRLVLVRDGLRRKEPSIDLPEVISLPPTVAWEAHKSLLASLLTTADWYAVATAYESVQILRGISKSDSLFVSEGRIPAHEVVTKFLMELITAIQAGAEAASRLAGNPDPNPQHPAYRHLSENVQR